MSRTKKGRPGIAPNGLYKSLSLDAAVQFVEALLDAAAFFFAIFAGAGFAAFAVSPVFVGLFVIPSVGPVTIWAEAAVDINAAQQTAIRIFFMWFSFSKPTTDRRSILFPSTS